MKTKIKKRETGIEPATSTLERLHWENFACFLVFIQPPLLLIRYTNFLHFPSIFPALKKGEKVRESAAKVDTKVDTCANWDMEHDGRYSCNGDGGHFYLGGL